jgi:hypothetical protein
VSRVGISCGELSNVAAQLSTWWPPDETAGMPGENDPREAFKGGKTKPTPCPGFSACTETTQIGAEAADLSESSSHQSIPHFPTEDIYSSGEARLISSPEGVRPGGGGELGNHLRARCRVP